MLSGCLRQLKCEPHLLRELRDLNSVPYRRRGGLNEDEEESARPLSLLCSLRIRVYRPCRGNRSTPGI